MIRVAGFNLQRARADARTVLRLGWISLLCVTLATPAAAQDAPEPAADRERASYPMDHVSRLADTWLYEVSLGMLVHDANNLWSGARLERQGFDLNLALTLNKPSRPLWRGVVRPYVGATLNTRSETSKGFLGGIWQYQDDSGWFARLGLGAAIHNGERETRRRDKKQLGSRVLFHIPIELGWTLRERHRVSLYFDHVSNANLTQENEGLDTIGLRYGYRY